jgi:hypothetical protein
MDDILNAVVERTTRDRLARRVTAINNTTRDRIRDMNVQAVDEGLSPSQFGKMLRGVVNPLESDKVGQALARKLGSFGSELRAETIARTEMRVAQNAAQLDAFKGLGGRQVELIDGDDDPVCAARNGRIVSLEEAEQIMLSEHPNGTLTFAPAPLDVDPTLPPERAPGEIPQPTWDKATLAEAEAHVTKGDFGAFSEVVEQRYGVKMSTRGNLSAPIPAMGKDYVHPALMPQARVDVLRGLERWRDLGHRPGDLFDDIVWRADRISHPLAKGAHTPAHYDPLMRRMEVFPDSFKNVGMSGGDPIRDALTSRFEGTIFHEVAHAFDHSLPLAKRAEFLRLHQASAAAKSGYLAAQKKTAVQYINDALDQIEYLENIRTDPAQWTPRHAQRLEDNIKVRDAYQRQLDALNELPKGEAFPDDYGGKTEFEDFARSAERWEFGQKDWLRENSPSRLRYLDEVMRKA